MRRLPRNPNLPPDIQQPVGKSIPHESAHLHVSGTAAYVDDLPLPQGSLHIGVISSPIARGIFHGLSNRSHLLSMPGVKTLLDVEDIPGHRDIGPVFPGDPLLCDGQEQKEIRYFAQPLAIVIADTHQHAWAAAQAAEVLHEEHPPFLNGNSGRTVRPSATIERGSPERAMDNSSLKISGVLRIGGQEHFYLEGQVALAIPTECGGCHIVCSTQHPSEVQKLVAEVLDIPLNLVIVENRRMGGAFGGKETQAAQWACLSALAAHHTGKPVKCRLPRREDFRMTGKRHPFVSRYQVGFDSEGLIQSAHIEHFGDCGHSPDLSDAIVDRAMFHSDNSYYLKNAFIAGHRLFSNCVSHTAFRGFGGPQGMLAIEKAMDHIARLTGQDPLDVRLKNLYGQGQTTHYEQSIDTDILYRLVTQLEAESRYRERRREIQEFNRQHPVFRKGLALTPVKFGISFTAKHLNQAGALVHIFTDGSVQVNHGGTEMGQGLHSKIAQIAAQALGISLHHVHVTSTRTDKVPNTSPTAASSGTDLNGQAVLQAATQLRERLENFLLTSQGLDGSHTVQFADDKVSVSGMSLPFSELVQQAYLGRVSLSATGFYATPKIHYDRTKGRGKPFFYFAHGAAVSEVIVDRLTGEYRITHTDILHDVGHSINPAIDRGQIEGGFVQGLGWLTMEELRWNDKGHLLSDSGATYKIPTAADIPAHFNVQFFSPEQNEDTIYRSKAVGEPPFMLAISVWSALMDAIAACGDGQTLVHLDTPATPERVFWAIQQVREVLP